MEVGIGDLPGVGPATKAKLESGGITTILDLAASTANESVDNLNITDEMAHNLVFEAQKILRERGTWRKTSSLPRSCSGRRSKLLRCTTYSKNLDALLAGGIETQAVTEFYGEFGSGKTQICHTVCVSAQLSVEKGGLGGWPYTSTPNRHSDQRGSRRFAKARGLDVDTILNNIFVAKIYNASHLELIVRAIGNLIQQNNVRACDRGQHN